VRSRSAKDVLLDASTLCYFAGHGLLGELRAYFGDRAHITREVERELLRLSERPEFAPLADHLAKDGAVARTEGRWPKPTKNLPDGLKAEFSRLLELKRTLGEHDRAHAGEIATVLMASHRQSDLVIMDDNWGGALARRTYGLEVMSTARLTQEMVAGRALGEDDGFKVYDTATPDGVGRRRFEEGLGGLR
jgi:hypothetical protein